MFKWIIEPEAKAKGFICENVFNDRAQKILGTN